MLLEDVEVSDEWLGRLGVACSDALIVAREIWTERKLAAALMVVADDPTSKDALKTGNLNPVQVLSRATSVFKVYGGNGHRFGYEVLAQARDSWSDWTVTYDNESLWRRDAIKLLPRGKESVEVLLKHLGLSPETTIRELDRLEPILVCTTCPATKPYWQKDDFLGRAAIGWRDMVCSLPWLIQVIAYISRRCGIYISSTRKTCPVSNFGFSLRTSTPRWPPSFCLNQGNIPRHTYTGMEIGVAVIVRRS